MAGLFKRVDQVVQWRCCMGCGACVSVCPDRNLKMVNFIDIGSRPVLVSNDCQHCGDCVRVCPGIEMTAPEAHPNHLPELVCGWGQVLEVWEGYAADPQIRYMGSSGGTVTALGLYGLKEKQVQGVMQIGVSPERPLENIPVFSRTREQLLRCTGSRYAPASTCAGLLQLEQVDGQFLFVGKPCEVAGLRKAHLLRPEWESKTALAVSIFCAGTSTSRATLEMLKALQVNPDEVAALRYRGCGWPGDVKVETRYPNLQTDSLSYFQSWGDILSKRGQLRCRFCVESTGEFADVSCGDPWYRPVEEGDSGRSLVLVRTEKGRQWVHQAIEKGYLELQRVDPSCLPRSQTALLQRRQEMFGRILAVRIAKIPCPEFRGFHLFRNWLHASLRVKIKSIAGTFKRILFRDWRRPMLLPKQRESKEIEWFGAEYPSGKEGNCT